MDRRTFLFTSLAATAGLLTSCGTQDTLAVTLLQGSIPPQLIGDFKKTIEGAKALAINPEEQLQEILELLQAWHDPEAAKGSLWDGLPIVGKGNSSPASVATLGDAWLESAIADNLIRPLDISKLTNWNKLAPQWQQLVTRNKSGKLDPQGEVYAAPYRFGSVAIAYRQDKLQQELTDWSDLWKPELKDRVSLLDDYRSVIGLTLKKLGRSVNSSDLSQVANLESELRAIHGQAKLYSNDKYLQPLVLGDTWAAVGWSRDLEAIRDRYPDVRVVVPASGTMLWADLWVQPQADNVKPLAADWIDFCWQPKAAKQILLFAEGISPIFTGDSDLAGDLAANPTAQATVASFERSEFINALPNEAEAAYLKLWQKIRGTT